MRYTTLGTTGLKVSAIGFGPMHFSLQGRPSEAFGINIIQQALALGVTLFDTADAYCINDADRHHNERLIHAALASTSVQNDNVIVATKGGCTRPGGRWAINGRSEHIRQAIRDSHAALGGDRPIVLWQHHYPDPNCSIEESLQPVREAVNDGLVRYVGVSNYSLEQIRRARDIVEVVSVQNQYNLWQRWPEHNGVLEYCEQEDLTFLPSMPLGGAQRARSLGKIGPVADLAREKGISTQRLVLAWLLARSPCILPIPGSTKLGNTIDALGAVDVSLSDAEVQLIADADLGP